MIEVEELESGRRIFRVDVGDLPNDEALAFLIDIFEKYRVSGEKE